MSMDFGWYVSGVAGLSRLCGVQRNSVSKWREPMPKAYEAMRDAFVKKGLTLSASKAMAAKIYNATRKKTPVTGKHKAK